MCSELKLRIKEKAGVCNSIGRHEFGFDWRDYVLPFSGLWVQKWVGVGGHMQLILSRVRFSWAGWGFQKQVLSITIKCCASWHLCDAKSCKAGPMVLLGLPLLGPVALSSFLGVETPWVALC